jgi:hypothetical protein
VDRLEPRRANALNDAEEPIITKSSTENDEPNLVMPYVESADPNRAKFLVDNADPRANVSSTESAEPNRVAP